MEVSQDHQPDEEKGSVQSFRPELLSLVVGITGHRDFDPQYAGQLTAAITLLLQSLREEYKSTPFTLLSPLAPGADRLAATVALAAEIPLYVPLPFPQEELPPGFVAPAERQDFETLCGSAEHVFFIGFPQAPPISSVPTGSAGRMSEAEMEAQYAAAGAFVAAHCHIMIALWDGEGGSQTARTLGYKRAGLPPKFAPEQSLLDSAEGSLWYHIYTPRLNSAPSAAVPSRTAGELVSHAHSQEQTCRALYRSIDEYNQHVRDLLIRPYAEATLSASRDALIQEDDSIELSPALARLRAAFAAADVLAIEFKQKAICNFNVLAVLVITATLLFIGQADCPFFDAEKQPRLLIAAAGLLLLAQWWRWFYGRFRYQDKFQDYRALAEGMRVQFYWMLLGLPDSVADHYLRKQRSELDWIRRTFSSWNIYKGGGEDMRTGVTAAQQTFRFAVVRSRWVEEQQQFFARKHSQNETLSHHAEVRVKRLLVTYIGMMAFFGIFLLFPLGTPPFGLMWNQALSLLHVHFKPLGAEAYKFWHGTCITLIQMPLIYAAFLHLRAEKFALTAQAKQYERMYRLFSLASRHLAQFLGGTVSENLSNETQVNELIRNLGREALAENADWVVMHRERRLEISSLS